jgi:hypothetical protein
MSAIYKLLAPGGHVIIFEHNPYNPVSKYIFNHNDEDAKGGGGMLKAAYCCDLLRQSGFTNMERNYTLFFLKRNKFLTTVEHALFWLPLGAQYYVFASKI